MSENRRLTDLLSALEKDNAALLSSDAPSHKFSRDFDKKALAVCRGDTKTQHRFICLFRMLEKLHAPGASAYKYRQNARCHRV